MRGQESYWSTLHQAGVGWGCLGSHRNYNPEESSPPSHRPPHSHLPTLPCSGPAPPIAAHRAGRRTNGSGRWRVTHACPGQAAICEPIPASADQRRNAVDAVRSQTYHNFCFPSIFGDEILTDATSELLKSLVRNCCGFEQNFTSIDRKVRREGLFKYFHFELSEALNNFSR